MKSIYDYPLVDLINYFEEIGETKYRASQVFQWLYVKRVKSFEKMTNLKKTLTKFLSENFKIDELKLIKNKKMLM